MQYAAYEESNLLQPTLNKTIDYFFFCIIWPHSVDLNRWTIWHISSTSASSNRASDFIKLLACIASLLSVHVCACASMCVCTCTVCTYVCKCVHACAYVCVKFSNVPGINLLDEDYSELNQFRRLASLRQVYINWKIFMETKSCPIK